MALTLTIISGDIHADAVTFDMPRIVLGRGEGSDVLLPDQSVSHRHATIRQRGADYIILDEGSTNGTFVGPVRLAEATPRVLKDRDRVRLGRVWLEVGLEHAIPTVDAPSRTKNNALKLVAAAMAKEKEQAVAPKVCITAGPDAGTNVTLSNEGIPYLVGRSPDCSLKLSDNDVSRKHIEIVRKSRSVHVRDVGSKNGARIAGTKLSRDSPTLWHPGQTLVMGATAAMLSDPAAEMLSKLTSDTPDEVVRGPVAPPAMDVQDAADVAEDAAPSASSKVTRSAPRGAPRSRQGWSGLDVAVAILALIVIAVSVGGLAWLIRG